VSEEVIIGDCRLILGDCREVFPYLPMVDAVIVDPPYSKLFVMPVIIRAHPMRMIAATRSKLGYSAHLTEQDVTSLCDRIRAALQGVDRMDD
jgi:hypothetical protein